VHPPIREVLVAAAFAAVVAGLVTSLLVPLVVRLAAFLGAIDQPGGRRQQEAPTPRLGGLAIGAGMALGAGGVAMVEWGDWATRIGRSELVAFALSTFIIFLLGLVDDLVGVSTAKKFLVQTVAAVLVVRAGWTFQVLGLPGGGHLELGILGPVLAVLWIVGVTNAINLFDGLDGLAGGVVAIVAASLLAYSLWQGNILTVVLMGAVLGSALGFLRHNWAPAQIFMGDSGSLTFGFLLGVMSVHASLKAPAAVAILVPILALGLPVMDTLVVMAVRFLARPKMRLVERTLAMFSADRRHLHHLLQVWSPRRDRVVLVLYLLAALFCGLALWVAVQSTTALGLTLLGVELVVVLVMRNLGTMLNLRQQAAEKRATVAAELRRVAERPTPAPPP
jgi:UDP-GlcNAc:undecaprenyl-phosphate/decaprenyl-phosphate GlcNAc-1-phosphate transferase